jgi:hypothetical protein
MAARAITLFDDCSFDGNAAIDIAPLYDLIGHSALPKAFIGALRCCPERCNVLRHHYIALNTLSYAIDRASRGRKMSFTRNPASIAAPSHQHEGSAAEAL